MSPEDAALAGLLEAIAKGDESSLGRLYDVTGRWLYGLIRRIVNDDQAAEEATMDVFLQVWRGAASYSSRRGTPQAWLITLARSRAIDRLRRRSADREQTVPFGHGNGILDLDLLGENDDPATTSIEEEARRGLLEAVSRLPAEQRKTLELAYFEGLTHNEIATRLGQPLGTVKTRLRLAVMKLRDSLSTFQNS